MFFSMVVALVLSAAVATLRYLSGAAPLVLLSDGFFVSGVLVLSFALLCLTISRGTIDSLYFSLSALVPFGKSRSLKGKEASKREDKNESKRAQKPALIVGVIFTLLGVFFSFF